MEPVRRLSGKVVNGVELDLLPSPGAGKMYGVADPRRLRLAEGRDHRLVCGPVARARSASRAVAVPTGVSL
jgi:hypothetical protein